MDSFTNVSEYEPSGVARDRQYVVLTMLSDSEEYRILEVLEDEFSKIKNILEDEDHKMKEDLDSEQCGIREDLEAANYRIQDFTKSGDAEDSKCSLLHPVASFFGCIIEPPLQFLGPEDGGGDASVSKMTQTSLERQDMGVNTISVSASISTQTRSEEAHGEDQATISSQDSSELLYSSADPEHEERPEMAIYASRADHLLRNTSDYSYDSDSCCCDYGSQFDMRCRISNQPLSLDDQSRSGRYQKSYMALCSSRCQVRDENVRDDEDVALSPFERESSPQPLLLPSSCSSGCEMVRHLMRPLYQRRQDCLSHQYEPIFTSPQTSWEYTRTFQLRRFDEIVSSHLSRQDRRLQALCNRMGCRLHLMGPLSPDQRELYRLTLCSGSEIRLNKALNCLQLSFPTSCLTERLASSIIYY